MSSEKIVAFTRHQIRAVREALGLTQQQFAEYLGVGKATVPRWELGKSRPSRHTLPLLRSAARKAGFDTDDDD